MLPSLPCTLLRTIFMMTMSVLPQMPHSSGRKYIVSSHLPSRETPACPGCPPTVLLAGFSAASASASPSPSTPPPSPPPAAARSFSASYSSAWLLNVSRLTMRSPFSEGRPFQLPRIPLIFLRPATSVCSLSARPRSLSIMPACDMIASPATSMRLVQNSLSRAFSAHTSTSSPRSRAFSDLGIIHTPRRLPPLPPARLNPIPAMFHCLCLYSSFFCLQ